GGDGGNTYTFAGADGHVEASSGDTVAYLPGSSGGVRIFGGGVTVEAVDGVSEYVECRSTAAADPPKLYLDTLDYYNAPYCPDPVVPPKLPAR
ncbi:MAG TPA: hypothetical protein VF715_16445, partial [Thermoleophilaceae bacterium]